MQAFITELDGTPEEIAAYYQAIREKRARNEAPEKTAFVLPDVLGEITPKNVLDVLSRAPVLMNARKAIDVLYLEEDDSYGLTTDEIAERMGISNKVLTGVFSAFSRRVKGTEGWPK